MDETPVTITVPAGWLTLAIDATAAASVSANTREGPRAPLTAAYQELNRAYSASRHETVAFDRPSIEDLIERSSLGTPGAKALRRRTPPEVVEDIVQRSIDQTENIDSTPPGGT